MITCKTTVNSKEPLVSNGYNGCFWQKLLDYSRLLLWLLGIRHTAKQSNSCKSDSMQPKKFYLSWNTWCCCCWHLTIWQFESLINLQKNGSLNALHQIHIIASQKEKLNQPWKQLRSLSRNQNRVVVIYGLDWIGQMHQQRNQVVVQNNTWCLAEQRPNYQQLMPYWSLVWKLTWRKC